jgi:hypothetical protein
MIIFLRKAIGYLLGKAQEEGRKDAGKMQERCRKNAGRMQKKCRSDNSHRIVFNKSICVI